MEGSSLLENIPVKRVYIYQNKWVLCSILFFVLLVNSFGQTREYATWTPVSGVTGSQVTGAGVTSPANAANNSNANFARITSSSIEILNIGAVGNAWLQLKFSSNRPAGATAYVRIADPTLTGVSLGLEQILGLAGTNIVGSFYAGAANNAGSTGTLVATSVTTRIVVDAGGNKYLAITPNSTAVYNSVRITLNYPSGLVQLGTFQMNVYNAFTLSNVNPCMPNMFADLGRSQGINIQLSGNPVLNPEHLLDANTSNYSELRLGTIGIGASASQTVYFPAPSETNTTLKLRLQINPAAVGAALGGTTTVKAFRGNTEVFSQTLGSLATEGLDVLGLLSGGGVVTVPVEIGQSFDRVEIGLAAVAGLNSGAGIRIYDVSRTSASCLPPPPTPSPLNSPVCASAALVAVRHVDEPQYAVDGDFDSYATVRSDAGVLLGLGGRDGYLEVAFDEPVPVSRTAYIRIDYDEDVLSALLGGSLGGVLADLVNGIALGNHYFTLELKNGATSVMSTSSANSFSSSNGQVRIVQDDLGRYYIAVTSSLPYTHIRLTDHTAALLGALVPEKYLNVYNICFEDSVDPCDPVRTYTGFDGSGLTLDPLDLNQLIRYPRRAIDDNEDSFSEISLGVLGVAGTTEQMIYFSTPVQPGNDILVRLATEQSLLNLGLFNRVELVAYSNGLEVNTVSTGSLLQLDLLGLLKDGNAFRFPINASVPIDRIGVRVSSLVGLGISGGTLDFSSVAVVPSTPEVTYPPQEDEFRVCQGETLTITPDNPSGGTLDWYRAMGESSISSEGSFQVPDTLPPGEYDFFVTARRGASCPSPSLPSTFKVIVDPKATPENYVVVPSGEVEIDGEGKYVYVEGVHPVILTPGLSDFTGEGVFQWYLDEDKTQPVYDGLESEGVTYRIENGSLVMTGLQFRDALEPYRFYLEWISEDQCPTSEMKEIDLSSIARILPLSLKRFDADSWENRQVKLTWELSSPGNGSIEIQRAQSDLNFVSIGTVALTDDSTVGAMDFLDRNPHTGRNYYRLKIQNPNSHTPPDYSEVRMVEMSSNLATAVSIYPNPFKTYFYVIPNIYYESDVIIYLININGEILREIQLKSLIKGDKLIFDGLESLPVGKYMLRIKYGEVVTSFQLIKG